MKIEFYKYQATGNDFVMIDNRAKKVPKINSAIISRLTDRNFGIGADGIILIEDDDNFDFKMIYYNADGSETFCGNGGRCVVLFAKYLKIISKKTNFIAADGNHFAEVVNENVLLKMTDVSNVIVKKTSTFVYTGAEHHVELVENLDNYPVVQNGRAIRYSYGLGSNVNFVQKINDRTFRIRTYEKGVENETLACGTGATAVAISMYKTKKTNSNSVKLLVEGGVLEVSFIEKNGVYTNVFLKGMANFVFKGSIAI